MAKKEKIEQDIVESDSEVITNITNVYFNDVEGNPKVKKTYWNKEKVIKEEIVND